MARSHVPKFGNWDGDNVPYTAYFDNARKEKTAGLMINPNDPEQNPEAFNFQRNAYGQQKSRRASESGSDKSTSDHSLVKPKHHRGRKKSSTDTSISPSLGHNRMNHADDYSYRSTSVPKFGEWDERDPRSGEGFTVIFNKVKEEKDIAASKFPPVPVHVQTPKNDPTLSNKNTKSKKFCCLF